MNEMKKFLFEAAMGYDYSKDCVPIMKMGIRKYGLGIRKIFWDGT